MKLYDFQQGAVDAIFDYFEANVGNPLVAMPTGTGKSHVIAGFTMRAFLGYPGQRLLVLTHVKELIAQNHSKLMAAWPTAPAGIYSAGLGRKDAGFPITYAGIASVVNCAESFGHIDLVIIDEAHLVSPKDGTMYQKLLLALRKVNPQLKVIGLTATPFRLGQGMLVEEDGLFTDVCFDMSRLECFTWLIDEGYLVPLVPRKTSVELSAEGVKVHAGEYVLKDLQEHVDKDELTSAVLKEAVELGTARQHWLVFASGVEHACHVRDKLEGMGIPAVAVHSKMDDDQRDRHIADFKAGKVRALVNNNILTTGFDFPALDLIVMLRPTCSPGLWVQMLGRGTRPVYAPGVDMSSRDGRRGALVKRDCLVLDFAGNTRRLGPINDPVIPKRKGNGGGGAAPVKVCPACQTYNHAAVRFCLNCGTEFPKHLDLSLGASTAALIKEAPDLTPVTYKVDRVTYAKHEKKDRPPAMVVSYFCGLRRFREWICLEHLGYASKRSRDWWRNRTRHSERPPPSTTAEALTRVNELAAPGFIKVRSINDHDEVLGCLP